MLSTISIDLKMYAWHDFDLNLPAIATATATATAAATATATDKVLPLVMIWQGQFGHKAQPHRSLPTEHDDGDDDDDDDADDDDDGGDVASETLRRGQGNNEASTSRSLPT